jgi:hypothetical protein
MRLILLPLVSLVCFCSRATVFSVVNPQGGLQFFTPHHVVAPWRYPKYHAEQMPWLQYVREQHCTYRVDVKHATDSDDIVSCLLGQVLLHACTYMKHEYSARCPRSYLHVGAHCSAVDLGSDKYKVYTCSL